MREMEKTLHAARPASQAKGETRRCLRTAWILICACLLGTSFQSCGDPIEYGEIPWEDIYVNFAVYPMSLDNVLLPAGNSKTFENEGVWGVFVYHIGYMDEEYVAFDLACPFDCLSNDCRVRYDKAQEMFVSQCGQTFSTYTGYCNTVSGYGLLKYNITYMGDSFVVSNN